MTKGILGALAGGIASGTIRVVDLTQTLSPDTPTLVLPPNFGQCSAFKVEEISRYDERGVAWYWNNFTVSEHTGTHFDAPIHWVTGKDLANNSVDTILPRNFVAPAVVIDCSAAAAANPDFLLTAPVIEAWEAEHGRIEAGSWVLMRTDWSKRSVTDYVNRREDGAHTPGPSVDGVRLLVEGRRVHGLGVEAAEGLAELVHRRIRRELGLAPGQGRRYSWGYPACPNVEDHAIFFNIMPCEKIALEMTEGFALVPEQSTVAVVVHHPDATYFSALGAGVTVGAM